MKRNVLFRLFCIVGLNMGIATSVPAGGAGLPGPHIVNQEWRDVFSIHSPLNNPAFLTNEDYATLRGVFGSVMNREFNLSEVGVTIPLGLYQSMGITYVGLNSGTIKAGSFDETQGIIRMGNDLSDRPVFIMASYAINFWRHTSIGANAYVNYATNFGDNATTGFGVDVGVTSLLVRHPFFGHHTTGIMLQNPLAFMDIGEAVTASNLKLSWYGTFVGRRIESGLDINLKDILVQADNFQERTENGTIVNAAKKLDYSFNYRIGLWLLRIFRFNGLLGLGESGVGYWGVGGGLNAPTVNFGKDFEVLYQYVSKPEGDNVRMHSFYVRTEIGKHREEIYARRLARLMDTSPSDLYNRALKLYHQEKYWDAFFVFGQILGQYPDFFKNDWVGYYMNSCREKMDMRKSAFKGYEQVKGTYPKSEIIPYADLGIMRICYRRNDKQCVEKQFRLLNTYKVPDSLRHHAEYLSGQMHFMGGSFETAQQLFSKIPDHHPDYSFAQHTMGVMYASKKNAAKAAVHLENSITATATTRAQEEIANKSKIIAGYLFYEQNALAKAVTALRMVDQNSRYYEDAQLGLGWAAVRAQQWVDCIEAGQNLQKVSKKPVLQAEGMLLEGYGKTIQRNYSEAYQLLRDASNRLRNLGVLSDDSLARAENEYTENREDYHELAQRAYDISLPRQTETILQMIDSLSIAQKSLKQDIDWYLDLLDEHKRITFFSRSADKVAEDLEYALATVELLKGGTKSEEKVEEIREEGQEIDDEIQRLKDELEQLEDEPENSPEKNESKPGK